jgi:hypothetical protein
VLLLIIQERDPSTEIYTLSQNKNSYADVGWIIVYSLLGSRSRQATILAQFPISQMRNYSQSGLSRTFREIPEICEIPLSKVSKG